MIGEVFPAINSIHIIGEAVFTVAYINEGKFRMTLSMIGFKDEYEKWLSEQKDVEKPGFMGKVKEFIQNKKETKGSETPGPCQDH